MTTDGNNSSQSQSSQFDRLGREIIGLFFGAAGVEALDQLDPSKLARMPYNPAEDGEIVCQDLAAAYPMLNDLNLLGLRMNTVARKLGPEACGTNKVEQLNTVFVSISKVLWGSLEVLWPDSDLSLRLYEGRVVVAAKPSESFDEEAGAESGGIADLLAKAIAAQMGLPAGTIVRVKTGPRPATPKPPADPELAGLVKQAPLARPWFFPGQRPDRED